MSDELTSSEGGSVVMDQTESNETTQFYFTPFVKLNRLPETVETFLFSAVPSDDSPKDCNSAFVINGDKVVISNTYTLFRESKIKSVLDKWKYSIDQNQDGPDSWLTPDENGEYVVQKILQHEVHWGIDYFQVKWRGWSDIYNSWEPLKHLRCPNLLDEFVKKRILLFFKTNERPSLPVNKTLLNNGYKSVLQHWITYVSKLNLDIVLNWEGLKPPVESIPNLCQLLQDAIDTKSNEKRKNIVANIKYQCAVHHLKEERKLQLKDLKASEDEFNRLSGGGLKVENNVDLSRLPTDFVWTTKYTLGEGSPTSLEGEVPGCDCGDECGTLKCCPEMGGADFVYSRKGRIKDGFNAIIECNRFCKCDINCNNRIVQRGRQVPLCIFRTKDRGWGVKSMSRIRKGAFLTTYLGELIGNKEAKKRDEEFKTSKLSYLFDLDFLEEGQEAKYSVDARRCGNESHFVNHSCDPNAFVAGVWSETLDPSMPMLALFARRDIKKGEEITFSYSGREDNVKAEKRRRPNALTCKCGSSNCRGEIF